MSITAPEKAAYLLEHDWEQEPRRLQLLEEHADPTSVQRLEATGIGSGWSCLEIGAGRGSIARWLGRRVGPSGHVTALDLDTSLLTDLDEPNIEVLEGDIHDIELPEGPFDLIHARLVLMHIPERGRALERIASLLRPGGHLVLEELDWMAILTDSQPERIALFQAFRAALPTIDFECGRALLRELDQAGFVDSTADFRVDVVEGDTPLAQWEQLSVKALKEQVLGAGTATEEQIESHVARLADPNYRGHGWAWIGARGRRNAASEHEWSATLAIAA
jgi:SAM-dependent methyltransferase